MLVVIEVDVVGGRSGVRVEGETPGSEDGREDRTGVRGEVVVGERVGGAPGLGLYRF